LVALNLFCIGYAIIYTGQHLLKEHLRNITFIFVCIICPVVMFWRYY